MANMNIQRNARVMATDGEVGRVTHVVVDPTTREVTHIVVEDDGDESCVPVTQVATVEGDRVTLRGGVAEIGGASRFEREVFHAVDDEEARVETTHTAERGGAPLVDADEDEVQIGTGRATRETVTETTERRATDRAAELPYHLRLREERLRVFTEREQAGAVRLGKRVVERKETVNVPLREERVIIERRAGSGEVVDDDIDTGRDRTVSVEVMRERAVVDKEAVVSEEVGVRKESVQHDERVTGTLRREELVVEGDGRLVNDQGREQRRAGDKLTGRG